VNDRVIALESALDDLRSSVRELEARIAHLERRAVPGEEEAPSAGESAPGARTTGVVPADRGARDPIAVLSLIGRLFIVLGGAYLLRAMSDPDTGAIAPVAGVALGLVYGLLWLALADRAGGKGARLSGVFHGVAAAMVAFPVVLEATTRFKVLPGPASAAALAVLTAGILAVAWRRRIQALAWIAVATAVPTSIVILARTGIVLPHAFFLIAFGVAALWMGYSLDWLLVRWPVAAVADVVTVGVTMRALAPQPQETPGAAVAVQVALLAAYLASIAVRTLVRGRNVIPFEVVQTVAAIVVGLGGALSVTRATGSGAAALGVASVCIGVACYGVAFAFIERRQHRGRNVYFYTSLAIVLVLVGVTVLLPGAAQTGVLAALAVASSAAWSRIGRLFLLIHASVYLVAAALASGAVGYDLREVVAGAGPPWPLPTAAMLVVLAAAALSSWLAAMEPADDGSAWARVPRFVIVLVLVLSAGGTLVGYLAPAIGRQPGGAIDAGMLATIRTGVLAIAALAVAWIGRHARFREWDWLVYPLLVGIGIKMVAQDFPSGRPATLFVALALYGAALIVAPRLRRRQA
jgi:hypothetical protein